MHSRILLCLAAFIAAVFLPSSGWTAAPVSVTNLQPNDTIHLDDHWLYQSGDDMAWADPDFDDSQWGSAHTPLIDDVPGEWTGIGWYRIHLKVDSSMFGKVVGLAFAQVAATEFYFNGELVLSRGEVEEGCDIHNIYIKQYGGPHGIVLADQDYQVLAVRMSVDPNHGRGQNREFLGLKMWLVEFESTNDHSIDTYMLVTRHQMFFTGLALAICLIHLLVYVFYPNVKANLYQVYFTLSIAILCFAPFQMALEHRVHGFMLVGALFKLAVTATCVCGLWLINHLLYPKMPKHFWFLAAGGALVGLGGYWLHQSLIYGFAMLVLAETTRVVITGLIKRKPGASIIGIGYGLFIIASMYQMMVDMNWVPNLWEGYFFYYLYGVLALLISLSILLAWQFTAAKKDLEVQLDEVQKLSAETKRQQEEAKKQDVARAVLVKEKAMEIEKARDLQRAYDELEDANRHLKETQAQLTQSEKMASLGMLVAGVAHEINTPVGAINSSHDTLARAVSKIKDTLDNDCDTECATRRRLFKYLSAMDDASRVIESGGDRVTKIVRRLRSFARLDEAELQKANINEGIEDTLILAHHELKHTVQVTCNYGDLPEIACYPGKLNQVFLNLLINARQAIEKKGSITITTEVVNGFVKASIADSGEGIPEDKLQKIFDPGFTTKGVGVGTGLGLSICYQIIQDHHGDIQVESEVGKGTTFTVKLPTNLDELVENT